MPKKKKKKTKARKGASKKVKKKTKVRKRASKKVKKKTKVRKRDSSLLTSEAVANIFNLPRSKAGKVYGSSVSRNGDYLVYRLDSVNNQDTEMDPESKEGFFDYLSDQRVLAEYSELLFAVQENSKVTRSY